MTSDMMNPAAGDAASGARDAKAVQAGTSEHITSSPDAKAPPKTRQQRWRERNPLAVWAHVSTQSAIRRGILTRPDRCECCGKIGKVEAHHPDHHNPLRVVWLAERCHRRLHAAQRRARKTG